MLRLKLSLINGRGLLKNEIIKSDRSDYETSFLIGFWNQYPRSPTQFNSLEMIGVFWVFKCWYSMPRKHSLVFPTGILSTGYS